MSEVRERAYVWDQCADGISVWMTLTAELELSSEGNISALLGLPQTIGLGYQINRAP